MLCVFLFLAQYTSQCAVLPYLTCHCGPAILAIQVYGVRVVGLCTLLTQSLVGLNHIHCLGFPRQRGYIYTILYIYVDKESHGSALWVSMRSSRFMVIKN